MRMPATRTGLTRLVHHRATEPPNHEPTHLSACSGGNTGVLLGVAHLAGLQFVRVAMAKTMPSTKQTGNYTHYLSRPLVSFTFPCQKNVSFGRRSVKIAIKCLTQLGKYDPSNAGAAPQPILQLLQEQGGPLAAEVASQLQRLGAGGWAICGAAKSVAQLGD